MYDVLKSPRKNKYRLKRRQTRIQASAHSPTHILFSDKLPIREIRSDHFWNAQNQRICTNACAVGHRLWYYCVCGIWISQETNALFVCVCLCACVYCTYKHIHRYTSTMHVKYMLIILCVCSSLNTKIHRQIIRDVMKLYKCPGISNSSTGWGFHD